MKKRNNREAYMVINGYVFVSFLSAVISLITGYYSFQRRRAPGAGMLSVIMLSTAIWSLGYGFELASTSLAAMRFWLRIEYLGIAFLPLWCLRFGFSYARREKIHHRRLTALYTILSLTTLVMNWTTEYHWLFYRAITSSFTGGRVLLVLEKGPFYWVHIAGFYSAILIMFAYIIHETWNRGPIHRHRTAIIMGAAVPPLAGNILYLSGMSPVPDLDLSPIFISFMGIILFRGLFRFRLFDAIPIARELIFEQIGDGLIVLDSSQRIVEMNRPAQRLVNMDKSVCFDHTGKDLPTPIASFLEGDITQAETELLGREVELERINLTDGFGVTQGTLITIHDITVRKRLEAERESLIQTLQEALNKVQTLNGLLPICSCCKKIRDDDGYWHQVEVYIHNHSGVDFSHGVCPDCLEKYYPEHSVPATSHSEEPLHTLFGTHPQE